MRIIDKTTIKLIRLKNYLRRRNIFLNSSVKLCVNNEEGD
jgi:hypothetical protein